MKISEKLLQAHKDDAKKGARESATFSFEFFPPKTSQGVQNLYDRMDRMYDLNPQFMDITWNAGGRFSTLTNEIIHTTQSVLGLESCMHLTCTNMPVQLIDQALENAFHSGCQNILALRGDPPIDGAESTGDFNYARDLILHIRKNYGDHFCIGVAAYSEGHPEETDDQKTLQFLKEKCDAGADFIVTQMFYDSDLFIDWCSRVRAIGITQQIFPGIMPISTYASFLRRASWSEIHIPQNFLDALDPIKDNDEAVRKAGADLVAEMCQKLLDSGYINHLHFYTMNLEKSSMMILERLDLIKPNIDELIDELPWRKSLNPNRSNESIRPIFWQNRKFSYVTRTSTWDEFPNGRWGDSRSPAFGEVTLIDSSLLRQSPKKALDLWGCPIDSTGLSSIMIKYLNGKLSSVPWSDGPLGKESDIIKHKLVELNERGFLTINSQPCINATKSDDAVYGWGPKNGYVYQKQYLEFFCPNKLLSGFLDSVTKFNQLGSDYNIITYYAVSRNGELSTNANDNEINAVTWGIFPGQEVLQPTIVEKISFLAWKDEAYQILEEWSQIFKSSEVEGIETAEQSESFLKEFGDNYSLVNIVNNDYLNGNDTIFKLFEGLLA